MRIVRVMSIIKWQQSQAVFFGENQSGDYEQLKGFSTITSISYKKQPADHTKRERNTLASNRESLPNTRYIYRFGTHYVRVYLRRNHRVTVTEKIIGEENRRTKPPSSSCRDEPPSSSRRDEPPSSSHRDESPSFLTSAEFYSKVMTRVVSEFSKNENEVYDQCRL
ncbi:hypothetical protein Lal_00042710 [Lupinus albus]|nr:hypothetical protein Lal_00042710 [Lupinus albus]